MTFEEELAKCQANMEKFKHLIVNRHHDPVIRAIYCGRGSKWGNQYTHLNGTTAQFKVNSREEAVVMHRRQFIKDIEAGVISKFELRNNAILLRKRSRWQNGIVYR